MAADVNNIALLLQPMGLAKDGDNNLVWCSDALFETQVNTMDSCALLNLVQQIQESMSVEQKLFDSINQQLAVADKDSAEHKNQSAALCASQARLARLCARNMRCFMQAMQTKQKETAAGASVQGGVVGGGGGVPSAVDGLISSVKRLQTNHTAMVKSAFKSPPPPPSSVGNSSASEDSDSPLYENLHSATAGAGLIYQNLPPSPPQHIYDQPKINPKSVFDDDEAIYESVDFEKGNSSSSDESALYENVSKGLQPPGEEVTYDVPWNSKPIYANPNMLAKKANNNASLLPQATKIILESKGEAKVVDGKDVDQDSLEDLDEPDIPSPDYGSDEDFQSGDFDLSGFADQPHVDFRQFNANVSSYYNEDQGLAVILEEPEEEEEEEYEEEDCVSTLSTASAGSVSRSSTPHEEVKLAAVEDKPDGVSLSRTEVVAAAPEPEPEPIPSPTKEQPEQVAPEKVVVIQEEKEEMTPIIAPQPVTCHQTNETEMPTKEEPKEAEFQLPSVKNLRSHFEGANSNNNNNFSKKEPVYVPKKFTTPKFTVLNTVNNVKHNNNNVVASALVAAANEPVLKKFEPVRVQKPKFSTPEPRIEKPEVAQAESLVEIASPTKEETRLPQVEEVKVLPQVTRQVSFSERKDSFSTADTRSETSNTTNNSTVNTEDEDEEEYVEPIMKQFSEEYEEEEILKPRPTTRSWDPAGVISKLYALPEPLKHSSCSTSSVTIEGYLDKLPSGKKKSTFWNAWKRRYFRAKDGFLYCYQNNQTEKASITVQLMGGKVESLETSSNGIEDEQHPMVSKMLGIDDGKGHYIVVRCANKQEKERWRLALNTHTTENFNSTYVNPWPISKDPAFLKNTIIIDLGSCSTRAGILCTQATLPQVFFPTIMAVDKLSKKKTFGADAMKPEVRSTSSIHFPVKPSAKITKYSVDINAVPGLFQKVFQDLNVDQKSYDVILSVPRSFNSKTQAEIINILFDQFGVSAVNMTHQSVLALYSYNATSGVVVDIGERMDIVPINEGYIVENGVSRVPYGGTQIVDHLRHFLHQKQFSLVTEVESFLIRFVLENLCYSAQHYNTEMQKFREDANSVDESVSVKQFFDDANNQWESINLDSGRFQSTEGLFNPDAWGLDNLGVHKLVHKAIRECSMDVRKEMTRSIFLSGGVTMLPGFAERLYAEVDKVTPKTLQPKVHASPYRYHAAYIGACVLANSPGVDRMKITKSEWQTNGAKALTKWTL